MKTNYLKPSHPTFFASPAIVYDYYDKKIPLKKIKQFLHSLETYTLHKTRRFKIKRNPFYLYQTRTLCDVDLAEMRWSGSNRKTKFILNVIDNYSKKLWSEPLKTKSKEAFLSGFQNILKRMGKKPEKICSDKERAVSSKLFQTFCKEQGIKVQHPQNFLHCPFVERVNRTMKNLLYRYMTHYKTKKYIDRLQDIVASYNNRRHRSIGMTPNQAEEEKNWPTVSYNLEKNFYMKNVKKKVPIFKKGMRVRIAVDERNSWSKSYDPYFQQEIFEIADVHRHFNIPVYSVKSIEDGQPLLGRFYAGELVRVEDDDETQF